MTRFRISLVVLLSLSVAALAADNNYLLNFDLIMKLPDGSDGGSIQLQGIGLASERALRGNDLGKYEYFLTVSDVDEGKGRLTIEFYEYETRKKMSDVVSEIVAEVEFSLGIPAEFTAMSDTFGVDLAFSIVER